MDGTYIFSNDSGLLFWAFIAAFALLLHFIPALFAMPENPNRPSYSFRSQRGLSPKAAEVRVAQQALLRRLQNSQPTDFAIYK